MYKRQGLNCVYGSKETRHYIFLRIRASVYTVIFIISIVLGLVLSVFGNSISLFVNKRLPFLKETIDFILQMRTVISFVVLLEFSLMVYRLSLIHI